MQNSLKKRVGSFPVIVSAATMGLVLVGAGCASDDQAKMAAPEVPPQAAAGDAMAQKDAAPAAPADAMKADAGSAMKPATAPAHSYKDGTYHAVGKYVSPAGPETTDVTLSVKDDKVSSVKVAVTATNQKSVFMQNAFAGGVSAVAVGKDLSSLNVGKVAGSSLTGIGFNDALVSIRAQAAVK